MEVKVRTMDGYRVKTMLEWRSRRACGMEPSKKNFITPFLYRVNLVYLFSVRPCAES
jgi:hypothetical protein